MITLVISKTSDITHVDVENGVLQVHELPAFVDDQPLAINGQPRGLLHSDADHLWVTDCDGVQPGDIIRQEKIFCTDHDILEQWRCDLAYFAQVFPQPFTDLFDAIEGGRPWPRQLTRGFVASLYKNKGDGGVDSYRPITVFPLLYRVWSTCHASDSLHSLMPVLPKSIASQSSVDRSSTGH